MFRPITLAPTFSPDSSSTRVLSFTSPPCLQWASRQPASGTTHSWSRSPPSPSGFSSLWFGPATKPSSDSLRRTRRAQGAAVPSGKPSVVEDRRGPEALDDQIDRKRRLEGALGHREEGVQTV